MKHLLLFPILILTLLLFGCSGRPVDPVTEAPDTEAPETQPPEPEEEGIDGIALSEFVIVADDAYGFTADDFAAKLQTAVAEKYGVTLSIISDETETTAHEIVVCSGGAHREVPEMEAGALVQDGHLFLYAPTNVELSDVVDRFIRDMLNAEVPNIISNRRIGLQMTAPEAKIETLKITGSSAKERGDNLRAAVAGLNLIAAADAPVEYIIELEGGEYLLTEPIEIGESAFTHLTFRAAEGATPTVTGAVAIPDEAFTKVEGEDYYVATIEGDIKARDIFVDGHLVPLARSEYDQTHGNFANVEDRNDPLNSEGLYMPKELIESMGEPEGSVEATFYMEWVFHHIPVTGVDYTNTRTEYGEEEVFVTFNSETLQRFCLSTHDWMTLDGRNYYYANHTAFLKPGTCVSDYNNGKLYYYPENGAPTGVSYGVAEQLFVLKDASNVTFEGIAFTGTTCHLTAERGYNSTQANHEPREGFMYLGAICMEGSRNIRVDSCTFRGLGTNGIRVVPAVNGLAIENCTFDDVGMSAISVCEQSGGHLIKQYENITIHNNLIENIGMAYPSAPAIFILNADRIDITHNTIRNCSYSGISLGWGWTQVGFEYFSNQANVRRANVSYNHITDFMRLLHDGGAIYVLGANCVNTYTPYFNEMHHNYVANPDKLQRDRGYYLDGSASNWYLYDNVVVGTQYPLFIQYHVENQFTYNNRCERIYSTETISSENYVSKRNVIVNKVFDDYNVPEDMLLMYPEAQVIMDDAGVITE